jgi:hypothetical protein
MTIMGTRTNDLTEFAKPVADELAVRCGSLKPGFPFGRGQRDGVLFDFNCSRATGPVKDRAS